MLKVFIKYLLLPTTTLFAFLMLAFPVFASVTFTPTTTAISSDDEIVLDVTLSVQGQSLKNYYLEGAFKKDDGTNYFGLTYNDNTWMPYTSSSNYKQLKAITTDSNGLWTGQLRVKIDSQSSYFVGSGNYILKIKKFTEAGSSEWSANNPDTVVAVTSLVPLPTETPTPSTTPIPTNTPSPTVHPSTTPLPTPSSAPKSSFLISSSYQSINSAQVFQVAIQLSNFQPTTQYYLKGAFFKNDSTNYFGKTLVSGNWIKNNDPYSSQLSITTDSQGNWQGTVSFMIDPNDSGYTGTANYLFKVGRYTSAGSGPTWSNQLSINVHSETQNQTNSLSTPSTSPVSNVDTYSAKNSSLSDKLSNLFSSISIPLLNPTSSSSATVEGIATSEASLDTISFGSNSFNPSSYIVVVGIIIVSIALLFSLKQNNKLDFILQSSIIQSILRFF